MQNELGQSLVVSVAVYQHTDRQGKVTKNSTSSGEDTVCSERSPWKESQEGRRTMKRLWK